VRLRAEACLLAVLAACATGAPAQSPPPPAAAPVSREAIQAATAALRRDPNLGSKHTVRTLHWIDGEAAPPPEPPPPWIVGLFQFLGTAGSLFLWIAGGIGLAVAAVFVYRLLRAHTPRAAVPATPRVSHIGEFDIRPTSLPADVGAAARRLLEAGNTREALALLYRGALSRAVHRFGVRIEESFTEGEALRAVEHHLDAPRTAYFDELVRVWQRAVYAGQAAAPSSVAQLCERFAPVLGGGGV
jgi:hypothetical protein